MNVDFEEVKKFDEMANYWWDQTGPCQPLHLLNPVRLAFIQSCCALPGTQIIDVGCGGGILTEALSSFAKHVVGLDQATQVLDIARAHAKNLSSPPTYVCSTVEAYADKFPQSFDVLTCMELLEHVPEPLEVVKSCAKLVKSGGDLFFSTLNRTPKAFLLAIVGAEYVMNILPKGTHRYDRFIRPSELSAWAHSAGLTIKHIKGLHYHPFDKTFSLTKDVSVNYLLHCQKD